MRVAFSNPVLRKFGRHILCAFFAQRAESTALSLDRKHSNQKHPNQNQKAEASRSGLLIFAFHPGD